MSRYFYELIKYLNSIEDVWSIQQLNCRKIRNASVIGLFFVAVTGAQQLAHGQG
jgi:hypothetical protein